MRSGKMSLLSKQYSNSKKFMARIELHRRFRTNTYLWTHWIFDQFKFPRNANVLELGSGNALLWKSNIKRIPEDAQILLTDFSEVCLMMPIKFWVMILKDLNLR